MLSIALPAPPTAPFAVPALAPPTPPVAALPAVNAIACVRFPGLSLKGRFLGGWLPRRGPPGERAFLVVRFWPLTGSRAVAVWLLPAAAPESPPWVLLPPIAVLGAVTALEGVALAVTSLNVRFDVALPPT